MNERLILRSGFGVSASLLLLISATLAAQSAPKSSSQPRAESGPVAISMARTPSAVILQGDGRVISFDTSKAVSGKQVFRIPSDFHAADVAAGPHRENVITCFTLNSRTATRESKATDRYASFVMQLRSDGQEVWTYLPERGVYIGVAIDPNSGYAYATNSTTNAIYRVVLGDEKAPVTDVARLTEAERLGAIAIDATGRRLFVADTGVGRVYIVSLSASASVSSIELPDAEEIRALAWHPVARRLFVADSGQEVVWSVDPERKAETLRLRDKRLREPSGLTIADGGDVWLVDEGARMAFQISPDQNAILRTARVEARD